MEQLKQFKDVMWELFRRYRHMAEAQGVFGVTLLDFSNAIPIPATTRSSIMPTKGPAAYIPSDAMLDKIAMFAEKYGMGDDVYEAAGRSPRMPHDAITKAFVRLLGSLPEDKKQLLWDEAKRIKAELDEGEREETPRQLQLA